MKEVITYATSGRNISFFCGVGAAIVTPLPVVMRLMATGVTRVPRFAKPVYAEATCNGVASLVPNAIAGYARGGFGNPAFAAKFMTRPIVTSIATSTVTTFKLWTNASRNVTGA